MSDSSKKTYLLQALFTYTDSIRRCIVKMPDEMYEWRVTTDEWNIQMVLAHLLHCEPLFRERLQRIADEHHPTIKGFGPDKATPVSDQSTQKLLDNFGQERKKTLDQIYSYRVEDWERQAIHSVQGPTTLKDQIQTIVDHDIEHFGQIYDLCELWRVQNQDKELR